MSSSAALEGGMAFLLDQVTAANIPKPELAQLCRRGSNNFIGVPTGIMDQFASLNGVAQGPILLDCHDLSFTPVDANIKGHTWMLANSMVTHELGSSEYPVRVRECAEALAAIRATFPQINHLSGATKAQLTAVMKNMSQVAQQRASFVIAENERVRLMKTALETGDLTAIGLLLNQTHRGLSKEYKVSCPEVDFLQAIAVALTTNEGSPIVAGARIMGGGFGGCTLNLVRTDRLSEFRQKLTAAYQKAHHIQPEFYEVTIGPGTRCI
jgi:galactokinase